MRRDILFIVEGIPPEYRLSDEHYCIAAPAPQVLEHLRTEAAKINELRDLRHVLGGQQIAFAAFRNDYQDEDTAIAAAYDQLFGMIDGLSLLLEGAVPRVSQIVHIRQEESADLRAVSYRDFGWLNRVPDNPQSSAVWKERKQKLAHRMLRFFDLACEEGARPDTDLARQIRFSAKMFRHGVQSRSWGVEYVCKFSALEGLVCGPLLRGKAKVLQERLPALFQDRGLGAKVKQLWGLRCEASHQAKAFHSDTLPGAQPLQVHIDSVDRLFTGVMVFALDNVDRARSVQGLWALVGSYQLPQYAAQQRPADMPRFPVSRFKVNLLLVWRGMGPCFDACFKASEHLLARGKKAVAAPNSR